MSYEALRARAAQLLDPAAFAYYDAVSGQGQTAGDAPLAWRRHRLRPRVLVDVAAVDTRVTLGRLELALPVLVAPMARHGLAHPDAERATVSGAYAAGVVPVVSARATVALDEMGLEPGRWWMQLYVLRDRELTRAMAGRARDLGASALVLTGDTPVLARRSAGRDALPDAAEQAMDATWRDLEELAGELPVWVKGVLRADDARRAADAGATGVIVSNHGGRQLDGAVASADALAQVVDAFGGDVLVDGGVRTGRDVVTALALGARAVLVGRPVLWALATGGSAGVTELLTDLHADLVEQFRLCGVAAVTDVSRDLLARRPDVP